jgi:hypothetical protein
MSDLIERLRAPHRIGAEFILTDLDVAMTFLDVAAVSKCEETISRNHDNARKAYTASLSILEKLSLDEPQRQAIEEKLARLKTRLDSLP